MAAHRNIMTRLRRLAGQAVPALAAAALLATLSAPAPAQMEPNGDPPNRVARIAWAQGNVSLEPGGSDSFIGAQLNYPLSAGDRVYADINSLSELQTSGLAIRLGSGADLTITTLSDSTAQFALAQGSIRLRTRDLYAPAAYDGSPQQALDEIDTPNATIVVQQPGDLRVDTYPQDGVTIVTVNSGAAEVSGQGFDETISASQSLRLTGYDQVYAEYVGLLPPDELDQFDSNREQMRERSIAFRNHYVDPEMIGAADLDQYGDWQPGSEFGAIWFPRNVPYGWTPYSVGHWAVVPPWGYTWVDAEPWGFAPFHYGRWNNFGGRWGWIPGPPPTVFAQAGFGGPPPRPVYSPALVAFVGGPGFSLSLSIGGGGGGVTAWFPLGPSEPYVPWYHTSPAYVNRVNVTNIYTNNVTQIHNTYINNTTTVYNVTNVTYVNRTTATVAVPQKDFSAGRSTTQAPPIKLDAAAQQQLARQPVVQHQIAPPPRMVAVAAQAPAHAVPPTAARPVVQTKQGFQRAGAPPSATPLRPPPPPPASPAVKAALPQPRPVQTIAPAKPAGGAPVVRNAPGSAPASTIMPGKPAGSTPVIRPAGPGTVTAPKPSAPVVNGRPAPAPTVTQPVRSTPEAEPPARTITPPAVTQPVRPAPTVPVRPAPATAPNPVVKPASPAAPKPVTPAPQVKPAPNAHPATPFPANKPAPPAKDEKQKDDKPKEEKPN